MLYLVAVVCPPLAFVLGRRWVAAGIASGLFGLGVLTLRDGWGIVPLFVAILWAIHAVGDAAADAESRRFVRSVRPLRWRP